MATPKASPCFKVNFNYPAPNGLLRSQSMIVRAADASDAHQLVKTQLDAQYPVYKITKVSPY